MKKLQGVVVPIVTPLNDRDELNLDALKKLTSYLIEKKIPCLYPCGSTGEMLLLTVDERKQIVRTVVEEAAGRATVFAQVGALTLKDTIELAHHAVDCGADGIGVVTPSYFKLSDDALEEYYVNVAQSIPKDYPMYLYAIPQNAINDISPALAARIAARCENVIGIKYSYPNMSRILEFMNINNGTFSVLCGPDELFLCTLCSGGDGTVSGNANVIPEQFNAVYDAFRRGDLEAARKHQVRANLLSNILSCENGIARYKAGLELRGISAGKMRAPMVDLSEAEQKKLYATLRANDFTEIK